MPSALTNFFTELARAVKPVAVPTKGDIRARGFDAAEKADCSIGGGSNAVSVLLI
jgi:hypothetical protein